MGPSSFDRDTWRGGERDKHQKRFIQSNVVIALASGWLDRMVKRLWCHQRYLTRGA